MENCHYNKRKIRNNRKSVVMYNQADKQPIKSINKQPTYSLQQKNLTPLQFNNVSIKNIKPKKAPNRPLAPPSTVDL
jgi:hypothetical protein